MPTFVECECESDYCETCNLDCGNCKYAVIGAWKGEIPRYQTTVAGRVVLALRNSGKEIVTEQDIDEKLESMYGITGKKTLGDYHALIKKRYLDRVPGGWTLKPESRETRSITIKIAPAQNAGEVMLRVEDAVSQYRGLVTIEMEA